MALREWDKIKEEYINGYDSVSEISRKYQCAHVTIRKRAIKEGWTRVVSRSDVMIPLRKRSKIPQVKTDAFQILRSSGVRMGDACKSIGISRGTGDRIERQGTYYDENRGKLLKKAVQTVKSFIEGKPIGGDIVIDPVTKEPVINQETGKPLMVGQIMPKGSDVMRASEAILDREQPKVSLSASITATFNPVDPEHYK